MLDPGHENSNIMIGQGYFDMMDLETDVSCNKCEDDALVVLSSSKNLESK